MSTTVELDSLCFRFYIPYDSFSAIYQASPTAQRQWSYAYDKRKDFIYEDFNCE